MTEAITPKYRAGWSGACERMAYELGIDVASFVAWGRDYVVEHGHAPSKAVTISEMRSRLDD